MTKYRIVKMKGTQDCYKVEKKGLLFWQQDMCWRYKTLTQCEAYIALELRLEKIEKENPRDVVVKTY